MQAEGGTGGPSALTCAKTIRAPQYKHLYHGIPVFAPTHAKAGMRDRGQGTYNQLCMEQVLLTGGGLWHLEVPPEKSQEGREAGQY